MRATSRRSIHHSSGSIACAGIVRHRQHQLGRLGRLVVAAQQLGAAEDVADVAARLCRHRVEQRLGVAGLLDHRDARLGDDGRVAAGAIGASAARRRRPPHRAACPCAPCGRRCVIRSRKTSRTWPSRSPREVRRCARPRAPGSGRRRGRPAAAARARARTCPWRWRAGPCRRYARTVAGSRRSCHSAASARRRSKPMLGQLGLSVMKAT